MNNDTSADAVTQADINAWHKVQNAIAAQAVVEQKAAKKRGQPIGRELARKDALAFLSRYCTTSLAAQDETAEAYEIGKRDGYEQAVQEIDVMTGGDGEYRYCTNGDPDRHTPDAATMKARIAERFNPAPSLAAQDGLVEALRPIVEWLENQEYNPFEPDNQSATFHKIMELSALLGPDPRIAALASIEVKS